MLSERLLFCIDCRRTKVSNFSTLFVNSNITLTDSLNLLAKVKEVDKNIFTKSGIMVGLGESQNEIYQVMDDMRSADIDFLTIGQYLQPTIKHHKVERFIKPDDFERYKKVALSKGFLLVSSSPLTRSSFHASEDFEKLKKIRINQLNN